MTKTEALKTFQDYIDSMPESAVITWIRVAGKDAYGRYAGETTGNNTWKSEPEGWHGGENRNG